MDAPLPEGSSTRQPNPVCASPAPTGGFLLATKLIAERTKDAEDAVALAGKLGMQSASPEQLEAHIRNYSTDRAMLEFIGGGNDVDRELRPRRLPHAAPHRAQRHLRGTGGSTNDA